MFIFAFSGISIILSNYLIWYTYLSLKFKYYLNTIQIYIYRYYKCHIHFILVTQYFRSLKCELLEIIRSLSLKKQSTLILLLFTHLVRSHIVNNKFEAPKMCLLVLFRKDPFS